MAVMLPRRAREINGGGGMKGRYRLLTLMVGALLVPGAVSAQAAREYVLVGSGGGGQEGQVATYRLDRASGTLTLIDREEVGVRASYIAAHPQLPVLYVTSEGGREVHWVRIDPTTGQLTPEGQQSGSGNPVYVSVDATGSSLLAVNYGSGTTDVFPLDSRSGAIRGPGTSYETGANSHSAVFHPNNRFVYVASVADNQIAQYAYESGELRPLSPATLAQPGGPRHMTLHPSGRFAYAVAGPTNGVSAFRIEEDGRLSSLGTVRRLPNEFAAEPGSHMGSDIHVAPSGRFAYAANRGDSNTLAIYSIGADGVLSLVGHEGTGGSTPRTFVLHPAGDLMVVGNQDSQTVAVFRIDENTGRLAHLHTEAVGVAPWFVGIWQVPSE
jgi:6-phosphogluconolactonase